MSKQSHQKPVTIISGGSRGLGLDASRRLLADGGCVSAFSRKATPEATELQAAYPDHYLFTELDISDIEGIGNLTDCTEKALGPITGLVNNAGMTHESLLVLQPLEKIDQVIQVNLLGTLNVTREVAKRMMVHRFGRIVTIASIVAVSGYKGTAAYSASKSGLIGITRALARELGGRNITVNAVCPGYMETDMVEDMSAKHLGQIVRRTPLGRAGDVGDVSGVIAFLLSDDARFISGQSITVDGGLTC